MPVRFIKQKYLKFKFLLKIKKDVLIYLKVAYDNDNADSEWSIWMVYRLEDAGYAVGARVLELLCHREKVWHYASAAYLCELYSMTH